MRYERKHLRTEEPTNIIQDVKNKAGVYRIYLSGNQSINRLNGVDQTGLLYIGATLKSNGLLKRVRDFFDSAISPTSTAHEAGRFYYDYLKTHFGDAVDNLEFEYDLTTNDDSAKNDETLQLKQYLNSYCELPPINRQLPKN